MKTLSLMIMTLGLIVMTSCKPAAKGTGVRVYTGNQRDNVTNTGGTPTTPSNCPSGQSAVGTIYGSASNAANFEQQVKLFLSANMSPDEIGTISSGPTDSTGVRFSGAIKLDSNGSVNLSQSHIKITVYDSYFLSGEAAEPIPVRIDRAHSGQFNLQNGQGSVIFKDSYGEIRLEGRIEGQFFRGTVSYANTVHVVNGSAPASGILGDFYIAGTVPCGMIQL